MARKWIADAINPAHKGEFKKKAEAAGKTTREYAAEKANAGGTLGKQARLAETLMGMHGGENKSSRGSRWYGKKD